MIYLDNNATTRVAPEVLEAMRPWTDEAYGNPSAGYRLGREARRAVERAREQVAALVGARPDEIVFTSGGTESNNAAIGSALALRPDRLALLTSTVEHSAVEEVAKFHHENGREARFCPVDALGRLDLDAWREHLGKGDVALAALIWANNETGVVSPLAEAAALAAEHDAYFHVDAVQAVGKLPVRVEDFPIHTLAVSAHKLHGPKGVGALWIHRLARFRPALYGGGQESGRRSGTENVAAVVGFGVAAELAGAALGSSGSIAALRDRFEQGVLAAVEGAEVNGDPAGRVPNTSNLFFPGVDGEGLLILLDEAGLCCSPGSACSTGQVKPSRIVRAMGHSAVRARASVRFSLSRYTLSEEVDAAVAAVAKAVGKLRVVLPGR